MLGACTVVGHVRSCGFFWASLRLYYEELERYRGVGACLNGLCKETWVFADAYCIHIHPHSPGSSSLTRILTKVSSGY